MTACDWLLILQQYQNLWARVIVEAMLCERPVVAAGAGGVVELVEPGKTGWLVPPVP